MNKKYFKRNFAKFLADTEEESYTMHKDIKTDLYKEVNGSVLEIGPGTGANFPFLNNDNINWIGLEPNHEMHKFLFNAAKENNIDANILDCTTEDICLPDNSIDYVISSEVLCSVSDLKKSITEIKRVLKPNGKFLFLEHVIDKQNWARRIIQKLVPYTPWRYYSDGCHPARDIGKAIKECGFSNTSYTDYMQNGKGIIISINRPHIFGCAIK